MKNSNDTIGNRARDLPVYITVPHIYYVCISAKKKRLCQDHKIKTSVAQCTL